MDMKHERTVASNFAVDVKAMRRHRGGLSLLITGLPHGHIGARRKQD